MFVVHDVKAGNYLSPFASMNNATAQREFATAILQEGHQFNDHAEDFSLWRIANYDTEKAEITLGSKELIANAFDLKNQLAESV